MRDPESPRSSWSAATRPLVNTPEEHQAQTAALVNQWIEVGKKVNLKE